ncbi:hypothetical protein GEMRC1_013793 [Eukaryota sp. GEM-RC1]
MFSVIESSFSLFLPSSIIADLLLAFEMTWVMFFSFFVFDKRTCLSFPLHQVLSLARYPIRLSDPLISEKVNFIRFHQLLFLFIEEVSSFTTSLSLFT